MRNPPILISVIGFFALVAGLGFFFWGLRVLGFDWFGLFGDLPRYEGVGLWGWFAVIGGIAWILVAFGLWALQDWARITAMIVAGISLFEAIVAFIQFPGEGIGFAMSLMPIIILLYLNSAEVKAAFAEGAGPDAM
jgi:hypothetical protein